MGRPSFAAVVGVRQARPACAFMLGCALCVCIACNPARSHAPGDKTAAQNRATQGATAATKPSEAPRNAPSAASQVHVEQRAVDEPSASKANGAPVVGAAQAPAEDPFDDSAETDAEDKAPADEGARPFANAAQDQDTLLATLRDADMQRFRPVGTSSIVFRASLNADFDAAFKSSSEKRPRAHAAEVAAYRLARLLGLDNVPPAVSRTIDGATMRSRMLPRSAWSELRSWIGENDGVVTGAAIYWISGIQESGLDTRNGTRRYSEWLRHKGVVKNEDRMLARDVSNMIAFDCLIGNWDRWSGGNMKGDATGQRLYIRDHDVAFAGRLSEDLQRRLFDRLTPVERFSSKTIARMRALTAASIAAELALDPAGAHLLDARQIRGVLDRRDAVLSHVDALIALHGARAVLFFP